MTSLDIILERIACIVYVEKRPFCFKDFLAFEHNGKDYRYKHGTIRNIFSELKKVGQIKPVYNAGMGFYTLKGVKVGKPITSNHTGDSLNHKQRGLYQFLCNMPMDKPDIHDIRLKFSLKGLWPILSSSSIRLIKNKDERFNKDIILKDIIHEDCNIKSTIHHTNTASIVVACTDNPIPIDYGGTLKLTTGLARVEERLQTIIDETLHDKKYLVPPHMSWIVNMWHFNPDSLAEYSGERFEMLWADCLGLFKIYSKKTTARK
jgi:hypothetical protein